MPKTPSLDEIEKRWFDPIFTWAQARTLVVLPILGVLPDEKFASWFEKSVFTTKGISVATSGRRADVLVVVGDLSHKMAPVVQRAYARLSKPGFVLHIAARDARVRSYALVPRVEDILPVDVRVIGDPPSEADFEKGLELLTARIRTGGDKAL